MTPTDAIPNDRTGAAHFFGEFFHSLDEKNRVFLPAAWRKPAPGSASQPWILVPSPITPCILGFSGAEFEAELRRVVSLAEATGSALTAADIQVFSRQFSARARQCLQDRQGRLLIPAEMLSTGGFGRELALIGNRRRIEIWTPAEWARRSASEASTYSRVASLAGL